MKNSPSKHTLAKATDSSITGMGVKCPPETFDREISADLLGKKRQGKKKKKRKRG